VSAPHIDIHRIAGLARLELSPDEESRLGAELSNVLDYIKLLEEVDVRAVEPMAHAVPHSNVVRADAVRPSLSHADALSQAPSQSNGLFIVPRIVE
jgi:aspartyl-tRNA(Asn)/glutamyl-tRNA(Gln) amidotransferase subunit C